MQTSSSVPRSAILIAVGLAALTAGLVTYRHLSFARSKAALDADTKLHRRNAVRRPRRRWRGAPHQPQLDYDPLARALEHLVQREASAEGYGMYHNKYYVRDDLLASHGDTFVLLPSRFEHIRDTITETHHLTEEVGAQLMIHIQAKFVQNFLNEEYPVGYIVNGDADELAAKLEPLVDSDLLKNMVELHDHGADIVDGDMWFADEPPTTTNDQIQDPADIAHALSGDDENTARNTRRTTWADNDEEQGEGQNILDLLYRIGEEQAKWSGYQHRGVECNGCGMQPIRGIRYHCANCWDYDLCETCEHQQIHHKTHVFYKIRIPAPTRGQIKLVQPRWYPGNPNACPDSIPKPLKQVLLQSIPLDRQDLDAFYDQFKCIAGKPWPEDRDGVCMAIDRPSFDRYFTSTSADRPPAPSLIYDRIFAFYDQNGDDLISFKEFATGMAELAHNTTREARLIRLFNAFDLDRDGYVNRRDFLRLLKAHYQLNKELAHEIMYARDDALLTEEEIHEVIHGNNPISAAFGGNSFVTHRSRHGQGKHTNAVGDLVLDHDLDAILRDDSQMMGNRAEAIRRQASEARSLIHGHRLMENTDVRDDPIVTGYHLPTIPTAREEDSIMDSPRSRDEGIDRLGHIADGWPTDFLHQADVEEALGANIPLDDVMDPVDRRRVLLAQRQRIFSELETNNAEVEQAALNDRWQRRHFYLDQEQGLTKPVGYEESDSSGDDDVELTSRYGKETPPNPGSEPVSLRSRSSSKVRFDDSAIDNDAETKSDNSLRNTVINERWGGFELSQPDRDVGVEIIYEAVQEAFNEMLNHFFKDKEDRAIDAQKTRSARKQYAHELKQYEEGLREDAKKKEQALLEADLERTNALLNEFTVTDRPNAVHKLSEREVRPPPPEPHDQDEPQEELGSIDVTINEEEHPDPTLPQNRPNEPSHDDKPEIKIDATLLAMWHSYDLIDREASERGGYGRLNIQEFKRRLRDETTEIDIGGEGQDEEYWDVKADLGKFSFLSSWIEMASF